MLGSRVLPDLLETMQMVLLRSTFASTALICAGSVESRTCNSGKPLIFPKVMRRTSGQRLEPPMPSKSACLKRAFFTSAAICFKTSICASCSSVIVSQPSQLPSSAPVQSEACFCQIGHRLRRALDVFGEAGAQLSVIAEGIKRRGRNGVHGVRADEFFDVDYVAILRILSASAGPQQALRLRALGRQ